MDDDGATVTWTGAEGGGQETEPVSLPDELAAGSPSSLAAVLHTTERLDSPDAHDKGGILPLKRQLYAEEGEGDVARGELEHPPSWPVAPAAIALRDPMTLENPSMAGTPSGAPMDQAGGHMPNMTADGMATDNIGGESEGDVVMAEDGDHQATNDVVLPEMTAEERRLAEEMAEEEARRREAASKKLRSLVRRRLGDSFEPKLAYGLEEQTETLKRLLDGVASRNRSDSCLLVGPHGSGKSLTFRRAIKEVEKVKKVALRVVHLHGSLHSDPRVACQMILSGLGAESRTEDPESGLTSLEEEVAAVQRQLVANGPTFVVLEEMERFAQPGGGTGGVGGGGVGGRGRAGTQQSVLYLLLDMLHVDGLQLGIVGVTSKVNCVSLFEKRVVSRFSQLQIRFCPPQDLSVHVDIVRERLLVDRDALVSSTVDPDMALEYNEAVTQLLENENTKAVLEKQLETTLDVRKTLRLFLLVVMRMRAAAPYLTVKEVFAARNWLWRDLQQQLVSGLSCLELCLLVSMATFELNQENPLYNFERTYENYQRFATAPDAPTSLYTTKAVAMKAFEALLGCEIIRPEKGKADSSVPKEYRLVRMTLDAGQVQKAVCRMQGVPTHLKAWAEHGVMYV